ncbi:hypothetical protein [Brevibacillus centrosporus]|uniref:hypothetical protein n=1 Tax=Brevibacillus centrosporus TaxID=54910 RepID=UPI002E1E47A2|nr:hypothetical protein [Brevibacillus centrosporus]
MSDRNRFPMLIGSTVVLLVMASSLFWTRIPIEGYATLKETGVDSFQFGYITKKSQIPDLHEWMSGQQGKAIFALPDQLYSPDPAKPLPFVYPIYDRTRSEEQFNQLYGYLPQQPTLDLGRTVYTVDYGNARFFFLRSDRQEKEQAAWVHAQAVTNPKQHHIALLDVPPSPVLWQALREAKVELVIAGERVYGLEATVVQEPSDFASKAHEGYGVWKPGASIDQPYMLMLSYQNDDMAVKATTADGEALDQMELSAGALAAASSTETVAVGIQQIWRYHRGDASIKAVIPEGFDVTGENPITTPFHLPADDWRSPDYSDAAWKTGRAPFGHTNRLQEEKRLQTRFKPEPASPSYYFRHTFFLSEAPKEWKDLIVKLSYEDGLILYFNGEEVFRDGIRTGLILPSSLAITNQGTWYREVSLRNHRNRLHMGRNTLAVQVHRSHPGSPNFLFDMSLSYIK